MDKQYKSQRAIVMMLMLSSGSFNLPFLLTSVNHKVQRPSKRSRQRAKCGSKAVFARKPTNRKALVSEFQRRSDGKVLYALQQRLDDNKRR